MDRFEQLVEEFVPDGMDQFDRDMVIKLMELAFRLGQNHGMLVVMGLEGEKHRMINKIRTKA